MKKSLTGLCAALALLIPLPASADDLVELFDLQISREGDLEMECGMLSQEALLMRDIIDISHDAQGEADLKGHGISAAGAVGSFLVGTVTGGVGLAATGFLLTQVTEGEAENAEALKDQAAQRRTLMLGIYNAKGCYGPTEHAMQDGKPFKLMKLASVEPAVGLQNEIPVKPRYND